MGYMDVIVLRRSLRLWWALPLVLLLALEDWHELRSPAPVHYSSRRGRGGGLMALAIMIGAMIYDSYVRFIRRDRLEFSEMGILDQASSDRLGQIRWEAVEAVSVNASLLGAYVVIGFKDGVHLNDRVESWDNVRIGPLGVSADDQKRISQMAAERKISTVGDRVGS